MEDQIVVGEQAGMEDLDQVGEHQVGTGGAGLPVVVAAVGTAAGVVGEILSGK
ncbi:MAG: hypothetical protein GY778_20825 [bacterium]|nr:hypothetical protein [bacterium]